MRNDGKYQVNILHLIDLHSITLFTLQQVESETGQGNVNFVNLSTRKSIHLFKKIIIVALIKYFIHHVDPLFTFVLFVCYLQSIR